MLRKFIKFISNIRNRSKGQGAFVSIKNEGLEGILKKQREEYQRYIKAVSEDFTSKVNLIGEQYLGIKEDIRGIRETLDGHTEMIGSMKVDIEVIKTDIGFIKNSLKKKVDLDEFVALNKRVAVLEESVKRKERKA